MSAPAEPPGTPGLPEPTLKTTAVGQARVQLTHHILGSTPPPDSGWLARGLWGFAQPLLGLRLVLRDADLRTQAAIPVLLLGMMCMLVALLNQGTREDRLVTFYATFLALAPVPSILFARHYARLAATVHNTLGLGPAEPFLKSVWRYGWESVLQLFAIAIGLAPVFAAVKWIPWVGPASGFALGSLWTLHWIVVEAFDCGRVLAPGQTVEDAERESAELPESWFVRVYRWPKRVPAIFRAPPGWFGNFVNWLSREWRAEIQVTERDPATAIGFGSSTALLLAVPVLNLLFRPAVVVGATHLRARLG